MERNRKKAGGGADLFSGPGMEKLDALTKRALKVSKDELDKRQEEYEARKGA